MWLRIVTCSDSCRVPIPRMPKYMATGQAKMAATTKRVPSETPNARARVAPASTPPIHNHRRGRVIVLVLCAALALPSLLTFLLHLFHVTTHTTLFLLHHLHHIHAHRHVIFHLRERLLRLIESRPHLRGIIRLLRLAHRRPHPVNGGGGLL